MKWLIIVILFSSINLIAQHAPSLRFEHNHFIHAQSYVWNKADDLFAIKGLNEDYRRYVNSKKTATVFGIATMAELFASGFLLNIGNDKSFLNSYTVLGAIGLVIIVPITSIVTIIAEITSHSRRKNIVQKFNNHSGPDSSNQNQWQLGLNAKGFSIVCSF